MSNPKGAGGRPPGVPDGMHKAEADVLWNEARKKAEYLMAELEKNGLVEFAPGVPEEEMAKSALKEAFVMAMSPLSQAAVKMSAIRTILEWTKAKPASKTDLTLASAEAWLKAVVDDHKSSE